MRLLSWKPDRSLFLSITQREAASASAAVACGQRGRVVHHVHSPGAGDRLAPDRDRRLVVQRLVRAPLIVKGDPFGDSTPRLMTVGIALEIDVLGLRRPPQPLDEYVVHPAAAAVHGDRDTGPSARR